MGLIFLLLTSSSNLNLPIKIILFDRTYDLKYRWLTILVGYVSCSFTW
jgi:hypothetical protein